MIILKGLFDHAVLQRDADHRSTTFISGLTSKNTEISVNVIDAYGFTLSNVSLEALRFIKVEDAYAFECKLMGIPVGGPFEISLTQEKTLTIKDVLVGDLYVLAGQSNMEGIGILGDKMAPQALTRAFYMDERWDMADDPLHDLPSAADPVHTHIHGSPFEPKNPRVGTGPGVAFGQTLREALKVPIGLIPCAHGGTSMHQWSPDYADHNGYGLYHMLIERIKKVGGTIKGLFWYQGCSDTDAHAAATYYDKMVHFIGTLRAHTVLNLPIVMVQIARMCSHDADATYWNAVQNTQLKLSQTVNHLALVASIDLEMDDFIHISGTSQNRLGVRSAMAMLHLIQDTGIPQPHLKSVHLETVDGDWNATIVLTYENIHGVLSAPSRPYGFSLTHMDTGSEQNFIYKIICVENRVLIKTTESELDLSKSLLHYGKGFMPFCNITDGADRALPAFSDFPLTSTPLTSITVTKAWCTASLDFNPSLSEMKDFGYYFLNAHQWFETHGDEIIYHIPFETTASVDLDLRFGGQGELKVYMNHRLLDAFSLSLPIHPNQYKCACSVKLGRHVLSVAYKPQVHPKGIFVRFVTTKDALNLVLLDPQSL